MLHVRASLVPVFWYGFSAPISGMCVMGISKQQREQSFHRHVTLLYLGDVIKCRLRNQK